MIVGGYTLDLYCDEKGIKHHFHGTAEQYYGRTFTGCKRQAMADGWVFHKNRTVTCPECRDKMKKQTDVMPITSG